MRQAVIIIGSSYGDEGKGLASVTVAKEKNTACLNILINGGAQRGHTVEWPDGRRHVFHHFGSASAAGAVSCADQDFIVNPLLFRQERAELEGKGIRPELYVSSRCRVSLPWDMMLGQIIEENRGAARHGSCGCGIQETRLRFLHSSWALPFGDLARLKKSEFTAYCRRIAREYLPERLNSLGMKMDRDWKAAVESDEMIRNILDDWEYMTENVHVYEDWKTLSENWPFLIFEAGQGLALDAENREDYPYLTPSRTTSRESAIRIAGLPGKTQTEILYVTRSYLTRHGPGPFPSECPKEEINPDMTDRTNVPNPHQQALRYGLFDGKAVRKRILRDLSETRKILPEVRASIMITHLNETGGKLTGNERLEDFIRGFDRCLLSDRAVFPE